MALVVGAVGRLGYRGSLIGLVVGALLCAWG
jgi:hypothetical protein